MFGKNKNKNYPSAGRDLDEGLAVTLAFVSSKFKAYKPPVVVDDSKVVECEVVEPDKAEVLAVEVPSQVEVRESPAAPKRNVADFFKSFTGKNVTSEQTTRELMVADDNLSMKTDIRDPITMSVWDTVGEYAKDKGYELTARTYERLGKSIRTNMVSYNGNRANAMERILTAENSRPVEEDMGMMERGFGLKKGSR